MHIPFSARQAWMSVAGVLALGVIIVIGYQLWVPVDAGFAGTVQVEIPSGSGIRQIGTIVHEAGIIRSARVFAAYGVITGASEHLQAGTYRLSPAQTIPDVLNALVSGRAETTDKTVIIPEGSNVWDLDHLLTVSGLAREGDFARVAYLSEGNLFPDTYRFHPDATALEIAQILRETFFQKAGYVSSDTLMIASLLEKEAKTTVDMRLVAGIIKKRLALGMALQIDASVAYGVCLRESVANNFSRGCDVSRVGIQNEINIDSPFNTYTRAGLPPRSISNPGLRAIDAAQHPTPSDYLYYLSTKDGTEIIYAKTYQEHLKNRQKYLGI